MRPLEMKELYKALNDKIAHPFRVARATQFDELNVFGFTVPFESLIRLTDQFKTI